ncbi:hypothetical protein LJC07_07420 [Christensenellaceae bacterium OttesenSCG-928-L17]|nr:hypothetical protein [Christensenellaceae bacterium OttesenSCG-928-L17]
MKKGISILLALMLVFSLAACGGGGKSDDPNVGKWNAVSASMLGLDMGIADLFEGGVTLELKSNGKFTLDVDGEKGSGKWEYNGTGIQMTASGVDMSATIANGKLTLTNLLGMGMDLTFEKEGGYNPAQSGTTAQQGNGAGYYILSSASEGGETMSGDDLRAMGFEYYIILNADGTLVFQTDNTVTGTWENGMMHLMGADGTKEDLPFTLANNTLTIDSEGLQMVFALSNETPPAQAVPSGARNSPAKRGNALQQWWNGDWYGFIYLPTADGAWESLEEGFWDCFGTIESDASGVGNIYLWDDGGELANVNVQITEYGVSDAGVAMSESGTFNKMKMGHADWIIDPGTNTQSYEHLLIIDGTFEDPDGSEYGGFTYEIWLRPWGMLWEDASIEDQPPGYADWYLARYTSPMPTMSEFLSGLNAPPPNNTTGGSSAGAGGQLTTVEFDSFTVGYPAGMKLEDDWLNGQVIKDAEEIYEVQFYQQYSAESVATVREEMKAYLKDPEAKNATEFSQSIGGMKDVYAIKYNSIIWNEAMFSIAYPQPINDYYGVQVRIKVKKTKNKIDDVLATMEVQAILESIAFK